MQKAGYRDVLKLPRFQRRFCVPRCRGIAESARHRLEQWLAYQFSARTEEKRLPAQPLQRERNRTEALQVALDMTQEYETWSERSLDEFLHFLHISLSRTPRLYKLIASDIKSNRPLDWEST
mmetsp:Transcript_38137/g.59008  ORF Transcript_38137/g.59008 Transcript_38137/m.59008 type:complete len:122 (-) Transcript_38137:348-713(-)